VGRVYRGAPVVLEAGNKPEGLKGLRVLVAEDEFAIAMFLVDYLELKGAQVVGPAGDLQALGQLVDTYAIDVALLDINLGGEQVYPLADRPRPAPRSCCPPATTTPCQAASPARRAVPSRITLKPWCSSWPGWWRRRRSLRASPDRAACRAVLKASAPPSCVAAGHLQRTRTGATMAWLRASPAMTGHPRRWERMSGGRHTCAPPST